MQPNTCRLSYVGVTPNRIECGLFLSIDEEGNMLMIWAATWRASAQNVGESWA